MDLDRELSKLQKTRVTRIPVVIGTFGTIPRGLERGLEELEIRMNQDHLDYRIVEISQNTKKNTGDLRKLGISLTPMKDHQIMLL